MRLDKYSNPIFNEQDIFEALYKGYQFPVNDTFIVDNRSDSVKHLEEQIGFKFLEPYETHFEIAEYDSACQSIWNMPPEYKSLNIENLEEELEAYKARNMLDLLRWLKYFVDTCSKEDVVWGVGRGSSVASFILYLIGVHNIDPIKYNLDWREFLR